MGEHVYNPSMEEVETGGCEFKSSLGYMTSCRYPGLLTLVLKTNTKQNRLDKDTSLKKILQYSPELLWLTYLDFSVHLSYFSTDLLAVEQSLPGERKQK